MIEAGGEGSTYSVPVLDEILRAYLELTGKRPRGKVLSKDALFVPGDEPSTPEATPSTSPDASPLPATPETE